MTTPLLAHTLMRLLPLRRVCATDNSDPIASDVSLNMIEETTGFTGPAPIHQSVVTGLLMAAVLGMVGAAVMLILVWAILGEIF